MKYRANGKLLITGEYLVLKGSKALAIPTKFGQSFEVKDNGSFFEWESHDSSGKWFEASFNSNCEIQETSDIGIASTLSNAIKNVSKLNNGFKSIIANKKVITCLDYSRLWGLGSSSTLISFLSKWADINPYELLSLTFKGSGYDIACASSTTPLFYNYSILNNPVIENVKLPDVFLSNAYFIYLDNKQDSQKEVSKFRSQKNYSIHQITRVSEISEAISIENNYNELIALLKEHEQIIAKVLNRKPIQELFFNDFNGIVKSLGAWGGDFILAICSDYPTQIKSYFASKGYDTFFAARDILL